MTLMQRILFIYSVMMLAIFGVWNIVKKRWVLPANIVIEHASKQQLYFDVMHDNLANAQESLSKLMQSGRAKGIKLYRSNKLVWQQHHAESQKIAPTWFVNLLLSTKQDVPLDKDANIVVQIIDMPSAIQIDQYWGEWQEYTSLWLLLWVAGLVLFVLVLSPIGLWIENIESDSEIDIDQFPEDIKKIHNHVVKLKLHNILTSQEYMEFCQHVYAKNYIDSDSKLYNYDFFALRFNSWLASSKSDLGGMLLLIKSMDEQTSDYLSCLRQNNTIDFLAIITQGLYVSIIWRVDVDVMALMQTINNQLSDVYQVCMEFSSQCYAGQLISKAKQELAIAEKSQKHEVYIASNGVKQQQLIDEITKNLGDQLAARELGLVEQPVFFYQPEGMILFHNEVYMRCQSMNNNTYKAGVLLPLIEKMQWGFVVDQVILDLVIQKLYDTQNGNVRLAMNLSKDTLLSDSFFRWFGIYCKEHADITDRLNLELDEKIFWEHQQLVIRLLNLCNQHGIKLGLDNFGSCMNNYRVLNSVKFDYIKLEPHYTHFIDKHEQNKIMVRGMIKLAHCLNMKVIATGVERAEEKKILLDLHIDALQGHYLGSVT